MEGFLINMLLRERERFATPESALAQPKNLTPLLETTKKPLPSNLPLTETIYPLPTTKNSMNEKNTPPSNY